MFPLVSGLYNTTHIQMLVYSYQLRMLQYLHIVEPLDDCDLFWSYRVNKPDCELKMLFWIMTGLTDDVSRSFLASWGLLNLK